MSYVGPLEVGLVQLCRELSSPASYDIHSLQLDEHDMQDGSGLRLLQLLLLRMKRIHRCATRYVYIYM